MKKIYLFALLVSLCSFGFMGCDDDDTAPAPTEEAPVVKLDQTVIEAPASGGEFTVGYTVKNPRQDGRLTLSSQECPEWLGEVHIDDNRIVCSVAENSTEEAREFELAFTYPEAAESRLLVRQAAGEPETPKAFQIELKDVSEMGAYFDIIPADKEMRYVVMTFYSDLVDRFPDDKDLVANDKRYFEQQAADYQQPFGEMMESNSEVGDQELYPVEGLVPGRKYTTYIYGISLPDYGQLTEVTRISYQTTDVPKQDIRFDIKSEASGVVINTTIKPIDYYDLFSYDVIEVPADATDEQINTRIQEDWYQMVALYLMFGETPQSITAMTCTTGECVWDAEKLANRTYVAYAYAVNEENAFMTSEVQFTRVKTGDVDPSDNVIDISVTDITPYTAKVTFTPSNEDPYAMVGLSAAEVEGLSQEQLTNLLLSMANNSVNGQFESEMKSLMPETEYRVYAFGFQSGAATTALFEKSFTTTRAEASDVKAELRYSKFYDAMQVAGLNPDYTNMAAEGTAFIPVDFVFEEGTTFYSTFFVQKEADSMTDEEIITGVIDRFGPTNVSTPYSVLRAPYGMTVVGVAFAIDREGRTTKLYRGEPLTVDPEKAGNPQEFVDAYPYPNSRSVSAVRSAAPVATHRSILGDGARIEAYKRTLQFNVRRAESMAALKAEAPKHLGVRKSF